MARRVDILKRQFGERLRAARIVAGYEHAADLAQDLGISEFAYRKYERGESVPPLDTLAEICRITGRSTDWLLLGLHARMRE